MSIKGTSMDWEPRQKKMHTLVVGALMCLFRSLKVYVGNSFLRLISLSHFCAGFCRLNQQPLSYQKDGKGLVCHGRQNKRAKRVESTHEHYVPLAFFYAAKA